MISHVVLLKLHPFVEGNSKHENALYIKVKLEDLQVVIPELQKIEMILDTPEVSE
jgi:fido (protein-threonine AMPylation protein)